MAKTQLLNLHGIDGLPFRRDVLKIKVRTRRGPGTADLSDFFATLHLVPTLKANTTHELLCHRSV